MRSDYIGLVRRFVLSRSLVKKHVLAPISFVGDSPLVSFRNSRLCRVKGILIFSKPRKRNIRYFDEDWKWEGKSTLARQIQDR